MTNKTIAQKKLKNFNLDLILFLDLVNIKKFVNSLTVISQSNKFRTALIIRLADRINRNFLKLVFSESAQNDVYMSITFAPHEAYFSSFFLSDGVKKEVIKV